MISRDEYLRDQIRADFTVPGPNDFVDLFLEQWNNVNSERSIIPEAYENSLITADHLTL